MSSTLIQRPTKRLGLLLLSVSFIIPVHLLSVLWSGNPPNISWFIVTIIINTIYTISLFSWPNVIYTGSPGMPLRQRADLPCFVLVNIHPQDFALSWCKTVAWGVEVLPQSHSHNHKMCAPCFPQGLIATSLPNLCPVKSNLLPLISPPDINNPKECAKCHSPKDQVSYCFL